jgi:hypothetical protein
VKTIPLAATIILIVSFSCRAQEPVPADLNSDFATFVQEFKDKSTPSLGAESQATWDVASVYFSRAFISKSTSDVFNKANVTMQASFPKQTLNPQPPSFNLLFPHIIKNCDPPCGSCDGSGPGRWACDTGRAVCIVTTAPGVAACLVVKAALDVAAGAYLGHVAPYDIELQANISASALRLAVASDLNSAQMSTNLNVHGVVQGHVNVDLTPLAGVFTACWPHQSLTIPSIGIGVSNPQFSAVAPFTLTPVSDGIQITTAIQQMDFDLTFDGNPIITVLSQNPQVYVSCPLPAGILTTIGVVNFFIPLKESESFTPDQVTTVLGKMTLDIPGVKRTATIEMVSGPLSIGLSETQPQRALAVIPTAEEER